MKFATVIFCLLFYCVLGQAATKITYNGNQLWKITNDNKSTYSVLKKLENNDQVTLWGMDANTIDAMIHSASIAHVKETLLENNVTYKVSMKDIQKAIDEENPKPEEDLEERKGYRLTWTFYHNLDDIYEYLNYLGQTYPKLVTVKTIGMSVEGRPIKLLKISNQRPDNKAVFIEGGIHAREWISPSAVTYLVNQFITNYDYEPPSIQNIDWYIVPVLNPDGYEYSYNVDRMWRKNRSKYFGCVGVDLNRNWGYDWAKNGSSQQPCRNSYRGTRPFSEPETAAVARFFLDNPRIEWRGYVAVHAYGQFIVYPWGSPGIVLEDKDDLNRVATDAATNIVHAGGEIYRVGSASETIYSASGTSMDWAKGAQAVKYSYVIELRDTGRHAFILPAKFIKPTSEEMLVAVRTIAKAIA